MNGQFPIYIVSKGRYHPNRRLTAKAFERMKVPYHIVVEEQEYEQYRAVTDPEYGTILILDPQFQRDYNACIRLEDHESRGSGPARNFAWQHSIDQGYPWHWVCDDNIRYFYRLNQNQKIRFLDGTCFRAMEDFVLRYSNVGMAGPAYESMTPRKWRRPPIKVNTRIFSFNLIRNDLKFRWRGRWNEDAILSLDLLKAGWCTIQFNTFLQDKVATQKIKGGNTDVIYANGTLDKSRMLVREHPDVARLVWRYHRWHHHVDYDTFKGLRLIRRPDVEIPDEPNEYGMKVIQIKDAPTTRW